MTSPAARGRVAVLGAVVALAIGSGCQDLREYSGDWTGEISPDPALNQGFAPGTPITATVTAVSRDGIALTVGLPGKNAAFVPIRRAAGDVLAETQLPGDPLRTFFGFVQPPGETPFLAVVTLFPENRLEMRLIRGADDAYGVFSLRRTHAP